MGHTCFREQIIREPLSACALCLNDCPNKLVWLGKVKLFLRGCKNISHALKDKNSRSPQTFYSRSTEEKKNPPPMHKHDIA